jgi:DNA-binding cell septation regulator SpoVG
MTKTDIAEISMATGEWRKTRAFVTVKFTNGLAVNGAKVIQGPKGLFVGMPSIQRKDKESGEMVWKECCWLEDEEDRKVFQEAVIEVYNTKIGGSSEGPSENDESSFF